LSTPAKPSSNLFLKGKLVHVCLLFFILSFISNYLGMDFWQHSLITIFLSIIYSLVLTALFALENPSYFTEKHESNLKENRCLKNE